MGPPEGPYYPEQDDVRDESFGDMTLTFLGDVEQMSCWFKLKDAGNATSTLVGRTIYYLAAYDYKDLVMDGLICDYEPVSAYPYQITVGSTSKQWIKIVTSSD